MREHALKRTVDYAIEPLEIFKMTQGTIFHEGLDRHCPDGWLCEVPMPEEGDVELWAGVPVSTRIDLLRADGAVIDDYKTSSPWVKEKFNPKTRKYDSTYTLFEPGIEQHLQLNVEAQVFAKIRGVDAPKLGIWKCWLGSRDTAYSWRYFEVPNIEAGALEAQVADGPNGWRVFRCVMQIQDVDERLPAIGKLPLAGRPMMNGKKCGMCVMREACDALIPAEERF